MDEILKIEKRHLERMNVNPIQHALIMGMIAMMEKAVESGF